MSSPWLVVMVVIGLLVFVAAATLLGVLLWGTRASKSLMGQSLPQQASALASAFGTFSDKAGNFTFQHLGQAFSLAIQTGKGPVRSTVFTRIGDFDNPVIAATLPPFQPAKAKGSAWGLVLRRENARDRVGKWLFINREVQTGEVDFDGRVYIESDAPEDVVGTTLGAPGVQRLVLEILGLGFTHVTIATGAGVAASNQPPSLQDMTPGKLARAAELLAEIGRRVPIVRPPTSRPPFLTWRGLFVSCAYLLTMASVLVVIAADRSWTTLDSTIHWVGAAGGLAAFLPSIPLVGLLLRGTSTSFRLFVAAVVPLSVGMPILGNASLVAVNGAFDDSAPQRRVCEVRNLRSSRGKSTAFHFDVPSWRPGEDRITFRASQELYSRLNRSSRPRVSIVLHDGALGANWYSALEVATPGE